MSKCSQDNIMKFKKMVQNRMDHRGQDDFFPGGTLSGDFSTVTDLGQIWRNCGRQILETRNFVSLRDN